MDWNNYEQLDRKTFNEKIVDYLAVVKITAKNVFSEPRKFTEFLSFVSKQFNQFNVWTLMYLYGKSMDETYKSVKQGYLFFKAQFEEYGWTQLVKNVSSENILYPLGTYQIKETKQNKVFFYELFNVKDNLNITQWLANARFRMIDKENVVEASLNAFKQLLTANGYSFKTATKLQGTIGIIDIDNKCIYISREFEKSDNLQQKWNYYAMWYVMMKHLNNNMQLELSKRQKEILIIHQLLCLHCAVASKFYDGKFKMDFLGSDIWDRVINFEALYEKSLEILKEVNDGIKQKQLSEYKSGILVNDFTKYCKENNFFQISDLKVLLDEDFKINGLNSEYVFYFDYLSLYKEMKTNDFLYVEEYCWRIQTIKEYQVLKMFWINIKKRRVMSKLIIMLKKDAIELKGDIKTLSELVKEEIKDFDSNSYLKWFELLSGLYVGKDTIAIPSVFKKDKKTFRFEEANEAEINKFKKFILAELDTLADKTLCKQLKEIANYKFDNKHFKKSYWEEMQNKKGEKWVNYIKFNSIADKTVQIDGGVEKLCEIYKQEVIKEFSRRKYLDWYYAFEDITIKKDKIIIDVAGRDFDENVYELTKCSNAEINKFKKYICDEISKLPNKDLVEELIDWFKFRCEFDIKKEELYIRASDLLNKVVKA
ncbi:hypothetical protein [Mycoplasma seminis]|uniref:Uncharacterized protein n=1 Tax=Mycoplasma seminis TaxID=512749 RepID=A0ABY9H9F8_9MOLU|nr:hypothetical protein [Mycoplasma seminis]WLP85222.1 hypothetical protein Q8852_02780 [Mycoplasma seminis]